VSYDASVDTFERRAGELLAFRKEAKAPQAGFDGQ
jgi:hypothetical protein